MKPRETEHPEEWTAYHEAGHCVIAVQLGGLVEWATIAPDPEEGPKKWGDVRVSWRGKSKWPGKPKWIVQSFVYLAGPAAEMVYREESLHPGFVPRIF